MFLWYRFTHPATGNFPASPRPANSQTRQITLYPTKDPADMPHRLCRISVLMAAVICSHCSRASAQELTAADIFPASTVLYADIGQPTAVLNSIVDHPVLQQVTQTQPLQKAFASPQFFGVLAGRNFFQMQMGTDWREALSGITAQGVYLMIDGNTRGAALLVHGRDEQIMQDVRLKLLELTRLGGNQVRKLDTYRDIPVYRRDKLGFAVVRDWLVVCNQTECGKQLLDRLLDAAPPDQTSLSQVPAYQEAMATRSPSPELWSWLHLAEIRQAGLAAELFAEKTENPLAELLFGGLQSVLRSTPWLVTSLQLTNDELTLQTKLPFAASWIPESRQWYFGPEAGGRVPATPQVPETLLSVKAYRGAGEMWLRAGDLFDQQTNDRMAEAEANLGTIFGGRDFGEEVLGAFAPSLQLLVARQDFSQQQPAPTIRLPGAALILTLNDPASMRPELRRTFQSAVGFFNIVGAQQGQPQLELDMQKSDAMDVVTAHYVVRKKDLDSGLVPLIYNFSPTAIFVNDQFILSSTESLARTIAAAERIPAENVHTSIALQAGTLSTVLADNREQLVSQNMLQKGQTHEEASAEFQDLLTLMQFVSDARLQLVPEDSQLTLQATVKLQQRPADGTEPATAGQGSPDAQ